MKKVTMFYFDECPHCRKAIRLEQEILAEHPEFERIEIERVNERERPEYADGFDYYYVPTYYVEGKKVVEGKDNKAAIIEVFRLAME